jgi:hypothetical protein|tara:strand:+ start:535 stop:768 length:234 start_codon:yes stop_codon:yes gene_type:complete
MFNILKFFKSKLGMKLLSILLGLGLASIFKMSCDNRSCLVFKGVDLKDNNVIKHGGKCYEATEKIETCDTKKEIILL